MRPEEHGLLETLQRLVQADDVQVVPVVRIDVPKHECKFRTHSALLVQAHERKSGSRKEKFELD